MKDVLIEAITKKSTRIEDHPAVEKFHDDGPGEYFVTLKKGFQWSGQHSFGTDTKGEAKKLLRGVTPCDDACMSCAQNKG
jgi:hypothetical protein